MLGRGVEDGLPYLDLRWSGTSTSGGYVRLWFSNTTTIPAAANEPIAYRAYVRLLAGGWSGSLHLRCRRANAAGSVQATRNEVLVVPTSAPLRGRRFSVAETLAGSDTGFARFRLFANIAAAGAQDLTLRLGLPQHERNVTALGGPPLPPADQVEVASLGPRVRFQGQEFQPLPIEAEGFAWTGRGAPPRPRLRVANIGGAIGGALGAASLGVSVGWALGGLAGNMLFGPKPPAITGPRLGDLAVQTSTYGAAIPLVFGTARVAGNIIWAPPIREQSNTRRVRAGKGRRRQSVTTFSYFGSWASALCAGPMAAVLRIWFDDKLVYDASGGSLEVQVPGLTWRFYPGDEAQLPDPLIEANVGAANAVAHRGLCYLVFEDVPLEAFGNRIPSVSAEVVAVGGQSTVETTVTLPTASSYSGEIYASDFERATVLLLGTELDDSTLRFLASVNTLTMEARRAFGPSLVQFERGMATQDGKAYVIHGPSGDVWLRKYDLDTGALLGEFESTTAAFTTTRTRFRVPLRGDCLIARVLGPFGWRRFFLTPPQGSPAAVYCIDADTMTYVFGSADAGDERIMEAPTNGWLAAGEEREGASDVWYAAPISGGGIELWRITITYAALGGPQIVGAWAAQVATYTNAALGLTGSGVLQAVAFDYNPDDNALILSVVPNTPSETAICKLRADGSIAWQRYFSSFLAAARSGTKCVSGGTWAIHSPGANEVILLDTRTGATLQTATTSTMPSFAAFAWDSNMKAAFYAGPGGVYRRLLMMRQGSDTVSLASIVSALCARAGLAAADINVAALTEQVRGFVVARPMAARQAIEPLATAFAFDAVERDDVLVFRPRGEAAVATVQHDDLIRRGEAAVIEEQRAQDAELPRAISVRHIDPDRAYEVGTQRWQRPRAPSATMASEAEATVDLPIVLTAGEAKTIARRLILAAWRERTRFSFAGTTQHLRLEPIP